MMPRPIVSLTLAGLVAAGASVMPAATARAADKPKPFDLVSPAFRDGGMLAKKFAGNNPASKGCDGENVSPPLRWSNAPADTKSFALVLQDTNGNPPLGYVHLLVYGISASTTALKEGALSAPGAGFTGGKNSPGTQIYYGPCPPLGQKAHPYIFTLVATDLAPDALAPGLTRDELAAALKGHVLGTTGLMSRYGH
jgi:Raf kinase inhibitor-like YbhB/YbcL family protein